MRPYSDMAPVAAGWNRWLRPGSSRVTKRVLPPARSVAYEMSALCSSAGFTVVGIRW